MYEASAGLDPELVTRVWTTLQLAGIAAVAGWVADRLLGIELPVRGIPVFCGLAGLYAGSWLWSMGGWDSGPALAGQALLPALAGALVVSAVFKLVSLGASGPRW